MIVQWLFHFLLGPKSITFPINVMEMGVLAPSQAGADAVLHAPRKIFYTLNGVFMGRLPGTMTWLKEIDTWYQNIGIWKLFLRLTFKSSRLTIYIGVEIDQHIWNDPSTGTGICPPFESLRLCLWPRHPQQRSTMALRGSAECKQCEIKIEGIWRSSQLPSGNLLHSYWKWP